MREAEVYLLSDEDCTAVCHVNAKYPRGPQVIICDYGHGPCVEETVIDDPMCAEWKAALEKIVPFSSRSLTTVTIDDDI